MESELITWLRRRLPHSHPCLRLGVGDDAAILQLSSRPECVVTVDLVSDQVDFILEQVSPQRVGHKALAVNLSDLAAMASRPIAAVVALLLPRTGAFDLAVQLYEGMLPLAERHRIAIAGGDTNSWDGPLAISITAIGELTDQGPLTRSGARPGDQLVVSGTLGGSILGRHLEFEPRVAEAMILNREYSLRAGIDISDGLAIDLARLARESGCGAELDLACVPISPAARQLAHSSSDGQTELDHALGDGEDFELLLAVSPETAEQLLADQPLDIPLTRIGQMVRETGLWHRTPEGQRRQLSVTGFEHRLS